MQAPHLESSDLGLVLVWRMLITRVGLWEGGGQNQRTFVAWRRVDHKDILPAHLNSYARCEFRERDRPYESLGEITDRYYFAVNDWQSSNHRESEKDLFKGPFHGCSQKAFRVLLRVRPASSWSLGALPEPPSSLPSALRGSGPSIPSHPGPGTIAA